MTMPKFHEVFNDVLEVLRENGEMHRKDHRDQVIERLDLTDQERAETMAGGGNRAASRVHWSAEYLAQAKAIKRPKRGYMEITQRGIDLLDENPTGITVKDLRVFPEFQEWDTKPSKKGGEMNPAPPPADDLDPIEKVESAISFLLRTVEADLLARIRDESPLFLEIIVLKLLHAMGYGSSDDDLDHLGGSGDGGVDGVIRQDKLGLEEIYVQAKRYQEGSSIGRPAIQEFVGALAGKGSVRGVFITTSHFSTEARNYAQTIAHQRIVLIDGEELSRLLVEHRIGVNVTQSFDVLSLDENFFEN